MTEKENRIFKELEQCRNKITETKRLIEYHKDILKKQESRESFLVNKLEKEKFSALCEVICKGGYDVDMLRDAVMAGDFSSIAPVKRDETSAAEKQSETEKNSEISEKAEKKKINDEEEDDL